MSATATKTSPAKLMEQELHCFAGNLQLARTMFRACPDLVTAKQYPPEWAPFFQEVNGHKPSDQEVESVPNLEKYRQLAAKEGL